MTPRSQTIRTGMIALAVVVGLAACAVEPSQCEVGAMSQAVQTQNRKILGRGAAYPANPLLRGRADEVHRSQQLRRQTAWQTVAKILAPVALNVSLPNVENDTLPMWRTWQADDDVTRLFQHLYEGLEPAAKELRQRFTQGEIDDAFAWNTVAVQSSENWPNERWQEYLDAINTAEKLAGIGGVPRSNYSPSAARHFLRSYPEIMSCMTDGVPDAFRDTPGDSIQQVVREPLALVGCASRRLGPYYVSSGEHLRASLDGGAGADAHVVVHGGQTASRADCMVNGGSVCEVSGPGVYYVTVSAGTTPLSGIVRIEYRAPNAAWAGCLESGFPGDTVITKASWERAQFGRQLPVWDTSAAALTAIVERNADVGWGWPDREVDPGPADIHTVELPNGSRFRLSGLHVMTKELDHWQWITLWWSDTPDSDFGADRPQEIAALPGPWSNYKMCVVTMFDERDPDPTGGFDGSAPTLAAALATLYGGVGSSTWCSNPYVELGAGNAMTNCIGCHQHAGTELRAEQIIGGEPCGVVTPCTEDNFPDFGNTRQRHNFPHDYSWAISTGTRLGSSFREVIDYYDATP